MQDLSPDMEDLLRRAADAYPLKQSEDKWNEIASKVSQNSETAKQKHNGQQQKFYAVLTVFCLLFSFLVLNETNRQNKMASHRNNEAAVQQSLPTKDDEKTITFQKIETKKVTILPASNSNILQRKNVVSFSNSFSSKTAQTKREAYSDVEDNNQKNLPAANGVRREELLTSLPFKNELVDNWFFKENISHKSIVTSSLLNNNTKKNNQPIKKGFYYGITAGAYLNAIKDQGYAKEGFHAGVIVGYRFNTKLSIETGLLYAKKYYRTQGQYFSMGEIASVMPSGMQMMEVQGNSGILEFPLHVCYDVSRKANHRFYSSVGISSYMLTEENNQYSTMLNGTEGKMYGTYSNHRSYVAASADLGLGYEKDLGNKKHIRIEPYLQLPLKGIGVGRLPVKSMGLRISLTRSVH